MRKEFIIFVGRTGSKHYSDSIELYAKDKKEAVQKAHKHMKNLYGGDAWQYNIKKIKTTGRKE